MSFTPPPPLPLPPNTRYGFSTTTKNQQRPTTTKSRYSTDSVPYQLRAEASANRQSAASERGAAVDGDNNDAGVDDDDDNGFSYFRRRPTSFVLNGSWRASSQQASGPLGTLGGPPPQPTKRYRWSSTAAAAADTVQYMESVRSVWQYFDINLSISQICLSPFCSLCLFRVQLCFMLYLCFALHAIVPIFSNTFCGQFSA